MQVGMHSLVSSGCNRGKGPRLVWQLNYVEFYFPSISLIDPY
jgi:hypothetical protein